MSHTATCERHDHVDSLDEHAVSAEAAKTPGAPGPALAQDPPGRRGIGPGRVWSFLALPEVRWSALSLVAFAFGLLCREAGAPAAFTTVFFASCYVTGGWEPGLAGLRSLRNKRLDVDLLMIVAALVAASIGQPVDGALLIVIFATSGALEAVATKRTRDSVRSLLALAPEQATKLAADGSEELVDTATLTVGDVVLVRPGERIGADGTVVDGVSDVDQASITGEPLPVAKGAGAEVFAGTLNGTGVLRLRVERAAADTVIARIVTLVAEASATKARLQLFIEKVEQRYSVAMVAATIALFLIPLAAGDALRPTLLRAMTFMIVASPCAVVLATMPPLLSSIANAGRRGVLVKSAVVMEQLGLTGLVAFDKTGTLSAGTPRLVEVLIVPDAGVSADDVLLLAAAAEVPSEHPVGRALVAATALRGWSLPEATAFGSVPGRGVHALVAGRRIGVGSPLIGGAAPSAAMPEGELVARLQAEGRTAVVVMFDDLAVGVLGLADQVRPSASDTVSALAALTGRRPVLLTGDNPGAAGRLAQEVGITDVRAGLLPEDKVDAVRELQSDATRVAVVGDGVNDAPALAAAHVGMAMGRHGADLTLETADVVIVRDELAAVPAVIDLSRQAKRIITQNLCFASAVICALVAVDLFGHLPLPLGVAGHEGSTVVVGLNGLRLLSRRSWDPTGRRSSYRRRSRSSSLDKVRSAHGPQPSTPPS